jgi:amino acid adenylation domain-containing protein
LKFLNTIQESLNKHANNNAFCINTIFHSYSDFSIEVSKIRTAIQNTIGASEKLIGLVANDDIQTYASIIALWFEGKAYIAINPSYPTERNLKILSLTDSTYLLDSSSISKYKAPLKVLATTKLNDENNNTPLIEACETDIAYFIFTSGSTGVPKGVPITYKNLNSFLYAIKSELSYHVKSDDKCLQMFELTFDMSVVAFLSPLMHGACVYTLPKDCIKYFYIYKLLEKHKLTILIMVPSIIQYLSPYFNEIKAEQVRYSCFAGGKLHNDLATEWNKSIPNAQIINYYGPTETTIYCGGYLFRKNNVNKHKNNVLSIGKPFNNTTYIVVDENNIELPEYETGELAIAKKQLFPGYWKNEEKNKTVFFTKNIKEEKVVFYRTGDLCFKDKEGDFMYVGRSDFQVKIRGYRIELGEIEYYAKKVEPNTQFVAIDILNKLGNTELALAVLSEKIDTKHITNFFGNNLPSYMVPTQFLFLKEFPHSINGKIDRKALRKLFK